MTGSAEEKFVLRLYVAGQTARSASAITALRRICAEDLAEQYEMVVIDVLDNPRLAEAENIVATPTLIKTLPPPLRRIIGDLSDVEQVLLGLELHREPAE